MHLMAHLQMPRILSVAALILKGTAAARSQHDAYSITPVSAEAAWVWTPLVAGWWNAVTCRLKCCAADVDPYI